MPGIVASLLVAAIMVGTGCRPTAKPEASDLPSNGGERQEWMAAEWNVAFQDVTDSSGVASIYRNGEESDQYSIVESLGGGVAVLDYDLSGNLDLFFPAGGEIAAGEPLTGHPGTLWRADAGNSYRNMTREAGVDDSSLYTHGVAVADIDSDGFPDILVTGYGGLQLFHNCGDGTFVERSAAFGLDADSWSSSAAWGDFDGDGHVDLYLTNYVDWSWDKNPTCIGPPPHNRDVCTPQQFDGLQDMIFWNRGDGSFERGEPSVGLVPEGKGLGVIAVDVNHDSQLDIYVANDTTNNFLYLNQGDRRFQESGFISGVALDHLGIPNGSMGLAVFDHGADLLPDLFVTNYERETFAVYRNEGDGHFRCISERTGITALGSLFVGFGTVAGDFNLNGREDLVVTNGHVMRHPANDNLRQHPLYLADVGEGRLRRLSFEPSSFFAAQWRGRGVVAADLNRNGLLDLVFSNTNEPAVVLENRSPAPGHSVSLRLIGTRSNRDAIGARVILETTEGERLRHVFGGGSYLSQGPYELHWGLPSDERPQAVEITWPDGTTQRIDDIASGQTHVVVQQ